MAEPVSLEEGLGRFYAAQNAGVPCGGTPGPCSLSHTRPNVSRSMKVRPKDQRRATADAKAKGVPTDFNAEGCPVFTSRAHQKRYAKAYGVVNHDGGYGD